MVVDDLLDLPLLCEVADDKAGKGSINFQPFDQNRGRDEAIGGYVLECPIVCGFIEDDSMLGLILNLAFRPLLFLGGFAAAGCWRGCFGLCLSFANVAKKGNV